MATHTAEPRTLTRLPSGVPVEITEHRYRGKQPGPTVYIQAAQHGEEVSGTELLRRLHHQLLEMPLSGEVITVPVANPLTFDLVGYQVPETFDQVNPNMNRVWPGDQNGTIHEQMAAGLWESVQEADVVIDLHAASPATLPHVLHTARDTDAERLAAAFGTDLLLAESADEHAGEEWHSRNFDGKLRVAAFHEGIPCITPEIGDSRRLDESAIEIGLTGIVNVLRELDAVPERPVDNGQTLRQQNHLGRVTATESGLFRPVPELSLGEIVEAGTHLGTVYAPELYEPVQNVTAKRTGIVYSITQEPTVKAGDRLVNIAVDRR